MDQMYPFNKYTPVVDGAPTPVGCLNLAIGTMFGYYEWPINYQGLSLDWTSMKQNYYDDRWARVLKATGDAANLHTSYNPKGSSSSVANINRTMKNWGFSSGQYVRFDREIVRNELAIKRLVIIVGTSYDDTDKDNCHAWLTDGGYTIHYYGQTLSDTSNEIVYYNYKDDYLHMIWGWGTMANGYYWLPSQASYFGANADRLDPDAYGTSFKYGDLNIGFGYTPQR